MFDRFASCAKSTVSLEEQTCSREGCVELRRRWQQVSGSGRREGVECDLQQLMNEVSRLNRKLIIVQKSKALLVDELALTKEELQNQKGRLKRAKQVRHEEYGKGSIVVEEEVDLIPRVILREKEEELEMVGKMLRDKDRELEQLRSNQSCVRDQIQVKNNMLSKLQESAKTQISYYKREIQELEALIESRNIQLNQKQRICEELMLRQEQRWLTNINFLQNKIVLYQSQLKQSKQKQIKFSKTIKEIRQKKKQTEELLQTQRQKNDWLTGLIQQAKTQFIHSQLVKLQQRDKHKMEQASKKRRSYMLSNHTKSSRSQEQLQAALPSAKTQRNDRPSAKITPFRLPPHDHTSRESSPQTVF